MEKKSESQAARTTSGNPEQHANHRQANGSKPEASATIDTLPITCSFSFLNPHCCMTFTVLDRSESE